MNRLPTARPLGAMGDTVVPDVGDVPSRYTIGVCPETPVPNLCPLNTVKSPSVMNGLSGSDSNSAEVGLVRRRLAARRRIPKAARRATPPSDPTIAGTRGTTAEVAVEEGVGEMDEVAPGPDAPVPVAEGLFAPVGSDIHVKPVLVAKLDFIKDVVMPLVPLRRDTLVEVAKGVAEILKKVGMLVIDGKGRVVRLDGRLVIMSVGFTDVAPTIAVSEIELIGDLPVAGVDVAGKVGDRLVTCVAGEITSDGVWVAEGLA